MALECGELLAVGGVPKAGGEVDGAGDDARVVRAEVYGGDCLGVALEGEQDFAGAEISNSPDVVCATGDDTLSLIHI